MSLPITDAMQQAQDAISGGNYRAAIATCSRLVKHFPSYAAAHRLLGEAYLEQGSSADAERSFVAALSGNPRHPWAYLGLGLIAEDRGSVDAALAYCQVAWELAPQFAQLREPVVRVSTQRYGADGKLQLTRAALAQLHANAARRGRAANEYRDALAELPERVDLRLGLAETLWRLGQDDEAARICAAVLEQQPDAVQALIVLTDIEHRSGNAQRADELRGRLRAVDPDGSIAADMLTGHARADRAYLTVEPDAVPELPEKDDAVVAERPHIAPAPDFSYEPTRTEARSDVNLEQFEPVSVEEFGGAVDQAASLDFEDFSEEPFDPTEASLPWQTEASVAMPSAAAFDALDDDLGALAASLEGDVANLAPPAEAPAQPSDELAPFDASQFEQPSDEVVASETDIADSLPPAEPPRGYTTVLQELDDAGLAPFDAADRSQPADESVGQAAEAIAIDPADLPEPPLLPSDELERMSSQWDDIDAEIHNAVPQELQRGFTDQLRSLEEIGLAPFEFEEFDDIDAVDAAPPAPAVPTAPAASAAQPAAHVEETLEVVEEVDALEAVDMLAPEPVAAPEPEPAPADDIDASLSGFEPFALDDYQSGVAAQAADAQASKSAVPSDEDLEALLAAEAEEAALLESQPEVAPEPAAAAEPTFAESDPFEEFLHSTMAATRELSPDLAESFEAAEPAAPEQPEPAPMVDANLPRIGTESLFDRARLAKDELVAEGVIAGDREFTTEDAALEPQDETVEALVADEPAATEMAEASPVAEALPEEYVQTGSLRDPETLRAALIADPHDAELRWLLAETLRERGDEADALTEYRWLIRHAPERHDAVAEALNAVAESGAHAELAHRLLADLYRRHGDVARSSSHSAVALQARQRAARAR